MCSSDLPIMISQLVAAASLSITMNAASDVLSAGPLPDESLLRMQRRLESLATTNRIMAALVGEICLSREIFRGSPASQSLAMGMGSAAGGSAGPQLAAAFMMGLYSVLGLNAADERFYLAQLDRMIAASRLPWPQPILGAPRIDDLFKNGDGDDGLPPVIKGRLKSRMMLPAMDGFATKDGETLARLRMGAAMLAIERFRARNGRIPGRLDELVPGFIETVPLDPFDAQPIRYKPSGNGYSLHCIGKDRKDDDARPPERPTKNGFTQPEPDIVLRVRR